MYAKCNKGILATSASYYTQTMSQTPQNIHKTSNSNFHPITNCLLGATIGNQG